MAKITSANGLRGLELRHLKAFEAVARLRSFGAAAQELGYTQSAISQQIADLERIGKTRMFKRFAGPRRVELTDAGRLFLTHAQAIVARVEAVSTDLDALAHGSVGDLRLGTFQSAATQLLPPLLTAFRAEWPRIELTLHESGSHYEIDGQVETGVLDMAFTHSLGAISPTSAISPTLEYVHLLSDPYCLVVAPDHPLAKEGSLQLATLGEIDLVAYRTCRANAEVERRLRSHGVEPQVVFRAEDNRLLQTLVTEGFGAAIMPLLAVDHGRDDVVLMQLDNLIPRRQIGLIWHGDRYQSAAAHAFTEMATTMAKQLAGRMECLISKVWT